MPLRVELLPRALDDQQFWARNNPRILVKCLHLLQETRRSPFEGIGKPEPLRGDKSGLWSRRITEEHRMIYEVTDAFLIIHALRGHYED